VKLTVTCDECGAARDTSATITTTGEGDYAEAKIVVQPCPNCAKLTYGPLTESMMWDAADEAGNCCAARHHNDPEDPGCTDYITGIARFVLRLLNEIDADGGLVRFFDPAIDQAAWLLDLARKP